MRTTRNRALLALTAAGLFWGTSVPLSKTALSGFGPGWLTVLRFAVAGVILLAVMRPSLRGIRPALIFWGALGYGACVVVQNVGLTRTSVTHAALLVGAVPVMVAVFAMIFDKARVGALAWTGFGLSLAGIAVVAGSGGGDASLSGDALILLSVAIGSGFTIVQARMLPGQDVIAVSAAQFLASAAVVVPFALILEGVPGTGGVAVPTSALVTGGALAVIGTVLPYTLFAIGQTGVAPQVAGAFMNLETLVAAAIGATVFGEAMGVGQVIGAVVLLVGIYLSTVLSAPTPAVLAEIESAMAGAAMPQPRAEQVPVRAYRPVTEMEPESEPLPLREAA